MANRSRKKRRANAQDVSQTGRQLLSEVNVKVNPHPDRHKLVALTMASLIAGLLFVINCDRVTHANAEIGPGGSRHGWPWIYLKRELAEQPIIFIHGRTYSWPYPPVKGEVREMSGPKLALDLLLGLSIACAVYWLVSWAVYRYDRWKYRS